MSKRLGFLGPEGTYTEQAGLNYDPEAELVPYPSIPAVASAVESGEVDEGVVPIENSLEGAVTYTLDLLIHDSALSIRQELVLPIDHCLVVRPGTKIEDIALIYSHPQALAQCRRFLAERFRDAGLTASLSTAASVQEMQKSDVVAAAIANRRAATLNGAHVLLEGIQDDRSNATRFVILAPTDHGRTGADKTSMCFDFEDDAPGIRVVVPAHDAFSGARVLDHVPDSHFGDTVGSQAQVFRQSGYASRFEARCPFVHVKFDVYGGAKV